MAILDRRSDKLAAPTEALTARPEPIRAATSWLDANDDNTDGVTAVLDQAEHLAADHPTSPAAFARLAHAALAAGRERRAREAARKVLLNERSIEDPPALVAAAQVLALTGDSESAERALALLKGRWFSYLYSQFALERGEFTTALARLDGADDPVSDALRGWLFLESGRFEDAIRTFRRVASGGFAAPELYINLGYAYGAVGSLEKAIKATQVAVGLAPANRTAAFNLAAFNVAYGDESRALATLRELGKHYPEALSISFAIAGVCAAFEDYDAAERELRRAVTSQAAWAAGTVERAELKANIAAIQWAQSKREMPEVRATIFACLRSTEFRSLSLARMMVPMYRCVSDATALAAIHRDLAPIHPADQLVPFSVRIAFLELELEVAMEGAEAWLQLEPFSLDAAAMFTYLLLEVKCDAARAAQVGRTMLRRFPGESLMVNNTAYALVLLGQCDEARRLLAGSRRTAGVLATEALADVRMGNVVRGLGLFEEAAETAGRQPGDPALASLIRYRAAEVARLVGSEPSHDQAAIAVELRDEPRLHIMQRSQSISKLFS